MSVPGDGLAVGEGEAERAVDGGLVLWKGMHGVSPGRGKKRYRSRPERREGNKEKLATER
jgi:hypothetical protein